MKGSLSHETRFERRRVQPIREAWNRAPHPAAPTRAPESARCPGDSPAARAGASRFCRSRNVLPPYMSNHVEDIARASLRPALRHECRCVEGPGKRRDMGRSRRRKCQSARQQPPQIGARAEARLAWSKLPSASEHKCKPSRSAQPRVAPFSEPREVSASASASASRQCQCQRQRQSSSIQARVLSQSLPATSASSASSPGSLAWHSAK